MTLGELTMHVSALPIWVDRIITRTSFNLEITQKATAEPVNTDALLQAFAQYVVRARVLLSGRHDGELMEPWTLTRGKALVMTAPRIVMLRYFMLNHLIHHRGQLTVYLSLCDLPVPAIYGPSADERTL